MTRCLAAAFCVWMCALPGCGGSDASAISTPTAPSVPPQSPTTVAVFIGITIVGNSGTQAFSPNPGRAQTGETVVFYNESSRTHRIVADDGEWDAGTIAAGASSMPITIGSTAAAAYHCTIHSSMKGSVN